jgi:hypothetical protein
VLYLNKLLSGNTTGNSNEASLYGGNAEEKKREEAGFASCKAFGRQEIVAFGLGTKIHSKKRAIYVKYKRAVDNKAIC